MASSILLTKMIQNEYADGYPTTKVSTLLAYFITAASVFVSIALLLNKEWWKNITHEQIDVKKDTLERKQQKDDKQKLPIAAIAASIFSAGLAISGMVKQAKIFGFLDLKGFSNGQWDGTLAMVMVGGISFSATGYHWVDGFNLFENENACSFPLIGDKQCRKFNVPSNKNPVDDKLLIG